MSTNARISVLTPAEAAKESGIDAEQFTAGSLIFWCEWERPTVQGYYEVSETNEITCTVGRDSEQFKTHHEARDWLYSRICDDQVTEIEALAWKFDCCLRGDLSAEDYARAIIRNRTEKDPGVCHSHDFCDANETMAQAFEIVTGRAMDLQNNEDGALWDRGWRLWRKATNAQPITVYLP